MYFQNQSLSPVAENDDRFSALLQALRDKQRAGLDVKIIFREFPDSRKSLEALKDFGFDMGQVRLQKNCHTKGIIVDGAKVLLGSHNWTNSGTLFNRDASLIFFHREIAEYYGDLFRYDWENLAHRRLGEELAAVELAWDDGEPPPGMRKLSWKDLYD